MALMEQQTLAAVLGVHLQVRVHQGLAVLVLLFFQSPLRSILEQPQAHQQLPHLGQTQF